ncbi:hypothetical protein ACFVT2_18610 [Streptomyces sp. NPDC058000]|uniref:hypothetical protein n=1 Tax=Streptomyces sp. NPDC058000 TaxID=3346299 RepID=UPI0036EAB4A3
MTRKDIDTRHAPAATGPLHPPHLICPTVMREHHADRRQERSRQGKPMNDAPWPNAARIAQAGMTADAFEGVV